MKEPTFDEHGYPTDETLETIKLWDVVNGNVYELMNFVKRCWKYQDWGWHQNKITNGIDKGHDRLSISTGGWSGNEALIDALEQNEMFMALYWESSTRGGHYTYVIYRVERARERDENVRKDG